MSEHSDHCCGGHSSTAPSTQQTLDELDFQRGVWSAAMDGEVGRVQSYLRGGGDPNAEDSSGYTALHYAARSGQLDICQILLDHRARVDVQTRSGGATPLHRTAYQGHVEVTKLLLRRGADVMLVDADGKSALHKAAERGRTEVCKLLLTKNSALRNTKDNRGQTAADLVSDNQTELREILNLC